MCEESSQPCTAPVLTPVQPHPARFARQRRRCDATQRERLGYVVAMAKQALRSALARIIRRFLGRVGLRPAGRTYPGDFHGVPAISYKRASGTAKWLPPARSSGPGYLLKRTTLRARIVRCW